MMIDCHTHICRRDLDPVHHLPTPAEQIVIMDEYGIDQSIILPTNCAEISFEPQSAAELLSIRDEFPARFIPFCCPDPRTYGSLSSAATDAFRKRLRQYAALGFRGIGEYTSRLPWETPAASRAACSFARFAVWTTYRCHTGVE